MENKKFTKDDIKAGYIVKMRDGSLNMVTVDGDDDLITVDENRDWMRIRDYDNDLRDTGKGSIFKTGPNPKYDIVEVYGGCYSRGESLKISTEDRDLLWKREEAKKMTVEEIEKELGYKIEIVS